jgi:hypothetical protein
MANEYRVSQNWINEVLDFGHGILRTENQQYNNGGDWIKFQRFLTLSANAGQVFSNPITYTYNLIYTTSEAYYGGVLSHTGDVHFIPHNADRGQEISASGTVITYSLAYTGVNAYAGGVLAANGEIRFAAFSANNANNNNHGQRIDRNGVVATVLFPERPNTARFTGAVRSPSGVIHFIPRSANVAIRLNSRTFTAVPYTLVYTTADAYFSGVVDPNGDIHFVPHSAAVGQKVSANNVVSTYQLQYTTANAYAGGVIATNGDIHFVPHNANRGQKVSANGTISTYSLTYTTTGAYAGGVLAPNGDIHFVPHNAVVGQRVLANGSVSTYSVAYTTSGAYVGGVLTPAGDIYLVPHNATVGQVLVTGAAKPFDIGVCCSMFLNKL